MRASSVILVAGLMGMIWGCDGAHRVEPTATIGAHRSIAAIAFSPSGAVLATGGNDWNGGKPGPSVALWDVASRAVVRRLPIPEQVQAVTFSPDGKTIAVADGAYQGQGHAYLIDAAAGARLQTLGGSTGWVHGLAFSPAGDLLASCGSTWDSGAAGQGYKGGQVAIWDVASGRERVFPQGKTLTCKAIAFDPKGAALVVGGGSNHSGVPAMGEVGLRDAATGRPAWTQRGHAQVVECVAFAPDGKAVASGGMDGVLKVWDAAGGKELFAASCGKGRLGRVLAVAFTPDGEYLTAAVGSFNRGGRWGEVRAWAIRSGGGREIPIYEGSAPVTCVAFAPDGRLLAAGDGEGTLRLWRTEQKSPRRQRNEGAAWPAVPIASPVSQLRHRGVGSGQPLAGGSDGPRGHQVVLPTEA